MNLKEYALRYPKPCLTWLDGRILQITHGVKPDAITVLSRAIFCNHSLIERFARRHETSPNYKHYWDILIEETSSELAMHLAELEAV